jgi:hypothetical protein
MGRSYVAEILIGISHKPDPRVLEVELEPIQPGAFAAWARSADADGIPGFAATPAPVRTSPVPRTTPKLASAGAHG